jgi:acylphosphatase
MPSESPNRTENSGQTEVKRVTVRYEGMVQGVGFRFTALRAARTLNVTGFVRNEYDGSVFLVAEGSETTLRDFLEAIRQSHVGDYIATEVPEWTAAAGSWTSFQIEF